MAGTATYRSATFCDFDAYAAAIEDADLSMKLPRLDRSQWTMHYLNLPHSIHVQVAHEGSGSLPTGAIREDGFVLFLVEGDCRANGERVDRDSFFLMPQGREFCLPTKGENEWMAVFIPYATAEATEITSSREVIQNSTRVVHPSRGATDRLRSCIKRFVVNAQAERSLLQEVVSVTSFHDALADCVKDCLFARAAKSTRTTGRPRIVDADLVARAVELIEDSPETTPTLPELVATLGISERSVQTGFKKYLGVSPQRYFELSRLHRARQRLLAGQIPETTVTKVAAQLGMWDLGRFAGRYAMLFGEKPSETLRRRERRKVTS